MQQAVILRAYAAEGPNGYGSGRKTILPPELPPAAIRNLPRCEHRATQVRDCGAFPQVENHRPSPG